MPGGHLGQRSLFEITKTDRNHIPKHDDNNNSIRRHDHNKHNNVSNTNSTHTTLPCLPDLCFGGSQRYTTSIHTYPPICIHSI